MNLEASVKRRYSAAAQASEPALCCPVEYDRRYQELRVTHPLIESGSIDVVVSNCVLNLVEPRSKRQLFNEIFRVLRKGGRVVISDIVSDELVPTGEAYTVTTEASQCRDCGNGECS